MKIRIGGEENVLCISFGHLSGLVSLLYVVILFCKSVAIFRVMNIPSEIVRRSPKAFDFVFAF